MAAEENDLTPVHSDDESLLDLGPLSLTGTTQQPQHQVALHAGPSALSTLTNGGFPSSFFSQGLSRAHAPGNENASYEDLNSILGFQIPLDVYNAVHGEQSRKQNSQTYNNSPIQVCNQQVQAATIKETALCVSGV
jgi:hypothetical protein